MRHQIIRIGWAIGVFWGLFSCGSKSDSKAGGQNATISFRNADNGLAQIQLELLPDHRLDFFMETIPQPGTEERSEFITAKGVWEKNDSAYVLTFRRRDLVLEALFDESYDSDNTFAVLNDSTVAIPAQSDKVWIWGVLCEKNTR